jgi:hypothetical protein
LKALAAEEVDQTFLQLATEALVEDLQIQGLQDWELLDKELMVELTQTLVVPLVVEVLVAEELADLVMEVQLAAAVSLLTLLVPLLQEQEEAVAVAMPPLVPQVVLEVVELEDEEILELV